MISINVWAIFFLTDRRQITLVTLNRFCPLRKLPTLVLNPLFFLFQVFKVLLIKKYKIQLAYQFLYFLLFYIASALSTSADIIFYNFLEPIKHFLKKKTFATDFHFLKNSSKPLTLLTAKIRKLWWKFFMSMLPKIFWFYIWVAVVWLLISQHKWLYVTSCPCPWTWVQRVEKCKKTWVQRPPNIF